LRRAATAAHPLPGWCTVVVTRRLLSPEGSLVAYAGPSERNARLFAALAANIWTTYDKDVKDALDAAEPETITIDYQVRHRACQESARRRDDRHARR